MIKTILFTSLPVVAALAVAGWRSMGSEGVSDVGTRPGNVQARLDNDKSARANGHELALFAAG